MKYLCVTFSRQTNTAKLLPRKIIIYNLRYYQGELSPLLQSVDQHFHQWGVLKACERIGFDAESISLDVPSDGITVAEWKVVPLTSPSVVRRMYRVKLQPSVCVMPVGSGRLAS